ncbi:MAG: TonB-dependent receptor plug domain-containing protein, partial [Bacteroidales bacterium]|nr:TonB-dependent receptor plug domain-containing protein [Bacteroidales bacterium]
MTKTKNQGLKFLIPMLALLLFPLQVFAQMQVTGRVSSSAGPEPGVIVFVKGNAGSGAMTDADGNYFITVSGPGETLVFSLMGYKEKEVVVGSQTRIDVVLEEDANLLEEVLVVGYGTQKKEFVVGSVSQVGSKDLLKAPNTNVSTMLAGRLAGVTAVQTTGIPGGDAASLLVRGTSTFNDSSPLILVDGVERSMTYLNPNDIETVSILKDAATAAIYGVRGANGVIVVTTKSGLRGKAQIVYDGSASFDTNTVTPDLLNADEYIYWHNKAREMDGQTPFWTPERIQSLKDRGLYGETDNWALIYND